MSVEATVNAICEDVRRLTTRVSLLELRVDDDYDDDETGNVSWECPEALEDLLAHCRLRNERPAIEAIEAAIDGKSFGYVLSIHSRETATS